jgi:hypothetical protein
VHEILLVARDTAERLVLAPLARRAARARSAFPGASHVLALLTESRVAAAVMDGASLNEEADANLSAPVGTGHSVSGPAQVEAARLRTIRDWNEGMAPAAETAPIVSARRYRSARRGATCVYSVAVVSPDGRAQHRELVAMHDSSAKPPTSRSASAARRAFARWIESRGPEVRRAAISTTEFTVADAIARYRAATAALERREHAMTRARPSTSRQLVQAGLFDSRAIRAHQARRQSTGALLEESEARIASLEAALNVTVSVKLAALLWHYCPDL